MSPEDKLHEAAAKVSADITAIKSIWANWQPYACLVAGIVIGIAIRHFV